MHSNSLSNCFCQRIWIEDFFKNIILYILNTKYRIEGFYEKRNFSMEIGLQLSAEKSLGKNSNLLLLGNKTLISALCLDKTPSTNLSETCMLPAIVNLILYKFVFAKHCMFPYLENYRYRTLKSLHPDKFNECLMQTYFLERNLPNKIKIKTIWSVYRLRALIQVRDKVYLKIYTVIDVLITIERN